MEGGWREGRKGKRKGSGERGERQGRGKRGERGKGRGEEGRITGNIVFQSLTGVARSFSCILKSYSSAEVNRIMLRVCTMSEAKPRSSSVERISARVQ